MSERSYHGATSRSAIEEVRCHHVMYYNFRLAAGDPLYASSHRGARCSSEVRAFAHGAMGYRIDPTWWTH